MIEKLTEAATVGSEWVFWLLILLSVSSISVIGERAWFFLRRRIDLKEMGDQLVAALREGQRDRLIQTLQSQRSVEAAVLARTLSWFDDGADALNEALEASLREHRRELEQGSVFLGTVGNNAPFIGLLGTVLGVVQAFQELERSAGNAMGSVMGGIAEALVATAAGIVVAIPAVVAFNIFTKKALEVEDNTRSLMSLVLAQRKSTKTTDARSSREA